MVYIVCVTVGHGLKKKVEETSTVLEAHLDSSLRDENQKYQKHRPRGSVRDTCVLSTNILKIPTVCQALCTQWGARQKVPPR